MKKRRINPLFYFIACKKISNVWYGIILDDEKRIVVSYFSVNDRSDVIASIIEYLPNDSEFLEIKRDKYALNILKTMSQIYGGKPIKYDFMLALDNLPLFTRRVLIVTSEIPRGFVGNHRGARAVGNVEARNPFAPFIPCHRVVRSTLDLGGYGGGLDAKRQILERENVIFDGNRVSRKCLWTPT